MKNAAKEMWELEYDEYLNNMEAECMDEEWVEEEVISWSNDAWENRDKECYSIVSVIHGCVVTEDMRSTVDELAVLCGGKHKILIIGTAETLPDIEDRDHPLPETGGRKDFFFCFHDYDILRVAVPRLAYGVRWWDDVVDNEWNKMPLGEKADYQENSIFPQYVFNTIGFGSGVYPNED